MEDSVEKHIAGDFDALVKHIQTISDALQRDARMVINQNVTTRAWLTGLYIVEYEQHGSDRAKYGTHLLQDLSKRLGGKSYGVSNLKNFRQFYLYYPDLQSVIGAYLQSEFQIRHSPNGELWLNEIRHSLNILLLLRIHNCLWPVMSLNYRARRKYETSYCGRIKSKKIMGRF